ncbi:MAG: fluoride efflux transporter CrcB [Peptoniphilus sp.]|nr:fluoride efflux transporter CrcB [Peptoniphilus sp.]MDY3119122.1 fluoride efflux transporter CrcB [Peptoniphilus sp.]
MQVLYAAGGGALGAATRFLLSRLPFTDHTLPIPTLLANSIGCFLMGFFAAKAEARGLSPNLQIFLKTGFCGGLTTFSAFSSETIQMTQKGQLSTAFFYVAASIGLGFFALYLGGQWTK